MNSDLTTLVKALTPTLGLAKELSVVGTGLASGLAVLELVRVLLSARVLAVRADKDALVHVGDAADRGLDPHLVAVHADLAADVDGGILARGELAPGLVDLADGRQRRLCVVEAREAAADALVERHGQRLARGQGPRHLRLAHVHKGALVIALGVVPDDDGDAAIGLVAELELRVPVLADPDALVGPRLGVLTLPGHVDLGHVVAVVPGQALDQLVAGEFCALGEGVGLGGVSTVEMRLAYGPLFGSMRSMRSVERTGTYPGESIGAHMPQETRPIRATSENFMSVTTVYQERVIATGGQREGLDRSQEKKNWMILYRSGMNPPERHQKNEPRKAIINFQGLSGTISRT